MQQLEELEKQRTRLISEIGDFGIEARAAASQLFAILQKDPQTPSVVFALASMGPEIIPEIKRQFETDSIEYRQQLLELVRYMDQDANQLTAEVVRTVDDRDMDTRLAAIELLGDVDFDPTLAVPALIKQLNSANRVVVATTARSLSNYESDGALAFEPLKQIFETIKTDRRQDTYASHMALLAMTEVKPNSEELLSVLIEALLIKDIGDSRGGWSVAYDALKTMSEMTMDIRAAETNLIALIRSADTRADAWKYRLASRLLVRVGSDKAKAIFREDMNRPLETNGEDHPWFGEVPEYYQSWVIRALAAGALARLEPDDTDAMKVLTDVAQQHEWLDLEDEGSSQFEAPISPLVEAIWALTRLDDLEPELASGIDQLPRVEEFNRLAWVLFWFRVRHVEGFVDDPENLTNVPFDYYSNSVSTNEIVVWLGDKLDHAFVQMINQYYIVASQQHSYDFRDNLARLKLLSPQRIVESIELGFAVFENREDPRKIWNLFAPSVAEGLLELARNFQLDFDSIQVHLKSKQPASRALAMQMLGATQCTDERAVQALIDGLSDPKPLVRMRAAQALGNLGPAAPEAREQLTKALRDYFYAVRSAAETALQRIDVKIGD